MNSDAKIMNDNEWPGEENKNLQMQDWIQTIQNKKYKKITISIGKKLGTRTGLVSNKLIHLKQCLLEFQWKTSEEKAGITLSGNFPSSSVMGWTWEGAAKHNNLLSKKLLPWWKPDYQPNPVSFVTEEISCSPNVCAYRSLMKFGMVAGWLWLGMTR